MSQLASTSATGGPGEHLFLSEDLSDMTILVKNTDGTTWRFPAHSLILSSQSVVFRRMLTSDFSEKNDHEIVIEDIKPQIVELLLGYIYRGKVHLESWHSVLDLLQAAHKYQIEPLVDDCARYLENIVTVNSALYIYNVAFVYSLISLKEKCLKLILDAGFVLLRSKAFEMLSKDAVLDIVTNSGLNIDSELTVFEALLKWAPMQCCRMNCEVNEVNILNALEPFLKYVCFDDMSDTEKSALPAAVLSCVKPNNRNRVTFCVPDTILPYTHMLNFSVDYNHWKYIGESMNCMRFSLDSSLYLIGLKFFVLATEVLQHFVVTLIKEGFGAPSNMFTINLASTVWKEGPQINDFKCYECEVLLRQPCRLEPKVVYKMHIQDRTRNAQCTKMTSFEHHKTIVTENNCVNISIHSEHIWGIQGFIFI